MINRVIEFGTYEEVKDGVPLKFTIYNVHKEILEDTVKFMAQHFLPREPLSAHMKTYESSSAVEGFKQFWRETGAQGTALIAIKKGDGDIKDRIVGVNMTYVTNKSDKEDYQYPDPLMDKYVEIIMDFTKNVKFYERYRVDKYLSAVGLNVPSKYSGYQIGKRLLETRKALCKEIGIKVTGTVFTNPVSIYLAQKVGFVMIYEQEYSKYCNKGEYPVKDLKGKMAFGVWEFENCS